MNTMTNSQNHKIVRFLTVGSWILLAVLVMVTALTISPWFSLSIAVGGIIAIINFYWLRRQLLLIFDMSPQAATAASQIRVFIRLGVWGTVIFIALVFAKLHPVGLLIGLSVLVINIFALTGILLFRKGGHT